jgi:ubiquinone/menaquinone biosynthesis C-methylase UbiE
MVAVEDHLAFKRAIASIFTRTSATHDRVGTPMFARFGEALVEHVGPGEGDLVLDVAAGAGATLFPAAVRIGHGGLVVGVDLASGMAERLHREVVARSVPNATVTVADAERLPFADRSFDILLCGFGLFFFPDVARALGEFRRVLRAGGTLGVSTFAPEGEASLERIRRQIAPHAATPPPRAPDDRFDEPGKVGAALRHAGFDGVEVETLPLELVFPDLDTLWSWIWSMEFRDDLERMDERRVAAARASVAAELAPAPGAPEIRFRMDALLTRARKPRR